MTDVRRIHRQSTIKRNLLELLSYVLSVCAGELRHSGGLWRP